MQNQASLSVFDQGSLYAPSMSLDARIRAIRKHLRLSQQEFGARFGVSAQAANQWEKPERAGQTRKPARPSKENLVEMAKASGAGLHWLLSGEGAMFDDHLSSEEVASSLDHARHIESHEVAQTDRRNDPDEPMTVGKETGRRGIPDGTLAQIDVTGGMGGGGVTLVSDGILGKNGMTFAAEHVRDYWRLPLTLLAGMGLRPHDTIVMPVQGDSMLPTLNEGDFVFVDTRHRLPSPDGLYALTDEFGGIVVKRLEVLGRRDEEVLVNVISDNERHPPRERMLSEIQIIGRVVRRFGVIV